MCASFWSIKLILQPQLRGPCVASGWGQKNHCWSDTLGVKICRKTSTNRKLLHAPLLDRSPCTDQDERSNSNVPILYTYYLKRAQISEFLPRSQNKNWISDYIPKALLTEVDPPALSAAPSWASGEFDARNESRAELFPNQCLPALDPASPAV